MVLYGNKPEGCWIAESMPIRVDAAYIRSFSAFFVFEEEMKTIKKNKKKKARKQEMRCPFCGGRVVFRSAEGIYQDNRKNVMLYICSHYPECDSYVRADPVTGKPIGTMADRTLRELRKEAHRCFDTIYKKGYMTKAEAYMWLSQKLSLPLSETHIGLFGNYYCEVVIRESNQFMENRIPTRRATG